MTILITPAKMRLHLAASYPACFKPKGAVKLPLKIGIHDDIVAREPWLTMEEVKAGLKDYTDGPKYLEQCIQGAWRVDLDGNRVSMVTRWQQQHSAARLARLRTEWSVEGKTLGDILSEALELQGTKTMASSDTANFRLGSSRNRAPILMDALAFYDTIRTMANRGTFESRSQAVEMIETRDRVNLEYGAEQANLASASPYNRTNFHAGMETVVRELRSGRKIEAIKHYRAIAGVGLKEAKDFVESMQGMPGVAVPVQPAPVSGARDFMVLTQEAGEPTAMYREGAYANPALAEEAAKRATERAPDDTVLMVKIIGRTKSVFSMVA